LLVVLKNTLTMHGPMNVKLNPENWYDRHVWGTCNGAPHAKCWSL